MNVFFGFGGYIGVCCGYAYCLSLSLFHLEREREGVLTSLPSPTLVLVDGEIPPIAIIERGWLGVVVCKWWFVA